MPQNYRLRCRFGPHDPDTVVPEYVFIGHDLPAMVADQLVEPTDNPSTAKLRPPKAAEPDPDADSMAKERNRLLAENKSLRDRETAYTGMIKELEAARDAHKNQLPKYVEENSALREACETHQKECEALTADKKALIEKDSALGAEKKAAVEKIAALEAENKKLREPAVAKKT